MTDPLISVLLPVRDAASTLGAALRSITRQSEGGFECVAVDDGSSDESLALLKAQAARDPRFVVIDGPARGIVGALGTGLFCCRGRYVARMDADDVMHPTRLARQLQVLESEATLAGVGCHVRLFPRHSLTDGHLAYERWLCSVNDADDVLRESFVESPLAHPTLFLRRKVLLEYGYADRGWPEDYDLLLRLLGAGARLGTVALPLLFWRDGPGRLSRTGAAYRLERIMACRAYYLANNFLGQQTRYVLWGYGGTGRALCRALRALGKEPSHIVELHPGRLGQRIAGAPVISPESLAQVRGVPIVVSVAGAEARALIRAALGRMQFVETRDYFCAA